MYVNRHKYFRWTRRAALISFMYVIAVPAAFGYIGYVTDVSKFLQLEQGRIIHSGR
jgi:hypothetical protein